MQLLAVTDVGLVYDETNLHYQHRLGPPTCHDAAKPTVFSHDILAMIPSEKLIDNMSQHVTKRPVHFFPWNPNDHSSGESLRTP